MRGEDAGAVAGLIVKGDTRLAPTPGDGERVDGAGMLTPSTKSIKVAFCTVAPGGSEERLKRIYVVVSWPRANTEELP